MTSWCLLPGVMSAPMLLSSLAASDTACHSSLRIPSIGFGPLISLGSPPFSQAVPYQPLLQSAFHFTDLYWLQSPRAQDLCANSHFWSFRQWQDLKCHLHAVTPKFLSPAWISPPNSRHMQPMACSSRYITGTSKLTSPKPGCCFFPSNTAHACTRFFLLFTANGDLAPQFLTPRAWRHPCFSSLLSHTQSKPSANTSGPTSEGIQDLTSDHSFCCCGVWSKPISFPASTVTKAS